MNADWKAVGILAPLPKPTQLFLKPNAGNDQPADRFLHVRYRPSPNVDKPKYPY